MDARRLTHFLPDVGALEADLFAESSLLYDDLLKCGEIERVKELSQLGMVRVAWEAARHSRWDFTVLLLDLIRRVADLSRIHVSSRVGLSSGIKVSSVRELMNCWALLLNVGHLHGTFNSETEVLFAVRRLRRELPSLETDLLRDVPPRGREWALAVLQQERTYQFYQLLAFYRIARRLSTSPNVDLWKTMLIDFVATPGDGRSTIAKARSLFRNLRRIAFLSLDSSLTPTLVEIRISQLATSAESLERLVSPTDLSSGTTDELSSLDEYLGREIYNGREVLLAIARSRRALRRVIDRDLNRHGLRNVVESFAKTPSMAFVPSARRETSLVTVIRGEIGNPFWALAAQEPRIRLHRRRLEDSFERWANANGSDARLILSTDARQTQLLFQVFAKGSRSENHAAAIAGAVLVVRRLARLYGNLVPWNLDQLVVRRVLDDIVLCSLSHFFTADVEWEYDDSVLPLRSLIGRPDQIVSKVAGLMRDTSDVPRSRQHELESMLKVARTIQASTVICSTTSIRGFHRATRTTAVELDGVIVGIDERRGHIVLGLVEAKQQASRPARSCRDQLRLSLSKLEYRRGVRRGPVRHVAEGPRGRAWTYARSPYRHRSRSEG